MFTLLEIEAIKAKSGRKYTCGPEAARVRKRHHDLALKYTTFFMTIVCIIILHEEYSSDFCILLEINMNIFLVPLRPEFGLVLKSGTLCVL